MMGGRGGRGGRGRGPRGDFGPDGYGGGDFGVSPSSTFGNPALVVIVDVCSRSTMLTPPGLDINVVSNVLCLYGSWRASNCSQANFKGGQHIISGSLFQVATS